MINQEIINSFLYILSTQFNLSYLDSGFFSILRCQGWPGVKKWFAGTPPKFRQRAPNHPLLPDDQVISIPCHIQGCNWVAVTRWQVGDSIHFYYADDLNDSITDYMSNFLFLW